MSHQQFRRSRADPTCASKQFIWFCFVPALAGAIALAGWTLGSERLKAVVPGLVPMNPLVAIGLVVLATALWLQALSECEPRASDFGGIGIGCRVGGRSEDGFVLSPI